MSPGWGCLQGWGVSRVAVPVWQLLMEEICSWLPKCRGAKIIYIVGMSNCHSHEEPVYVVRWLCITWSQSWSQSWLTDESSHYSSLVSCDFHCGTVHIMLFAMTNVQFIASVTMSGDKWVVPRSRLPHNNDKIHKTHRKRAQTPPRPLHCRPLASEHIS